jgi:hypothetical protein
MKPLFDIIEDHEQEVERVVEDLASVLEGNNMGVVLPAMASLLINACMGAEVPKHYLKQYMASMIDFYYLTSTPSEDDSPIH